MLLVSRISPLWTIVWFMLVSLLFVPVLSAPLPVRRPSAWDTLTNAQRLARGLPVSAA